MARPSWLGDASRRLPAFYLLRVMPATAALAIDRATAQSRGSGGRSLELGFSEYDRRQYSNSGKKIHSSGRRPRTTPFHTTAIGMFIQNPFPT
jgi:hypothetical protein